MYRQSSRHSGAGNDGRPADQTGEAAGADLDLEALHAFSTALHAATRVEEVQEAVLATVTEGLRFDRAVIGVVDALAEQGEGEGALTGWLGVSRTGGKRGREPLAHPARIPLSAAGGPVAQAVLERRIGRVTEAPCSAHRGMNEHFDMESCLIVPLLWGFRPAGVLLVDAPTGQGEGKSNGARSSSR